MAPKAGKHRRIVPLLVVAVATLVGLAVAELAVRLLASPPRVLGAIGFQKEDGTPIADYAEGVRQGLIVPVPGETYMCEAPSLKSPFIFG